MSLITLQAITKYVSIGQRALHILGQKYRSQAARAVAYVSTVLTATGQLNGRWQIETHEPIATKFRTIDYVRERTP